MKTFLDIPVTSFAHATLNTYKGVKLSHDLAGVNYTDIIEGMKHEGVTAVLRKHVKRKNNMYDTNTSVLTVNKATVDQMDKFGVLQDN